MPNEERPLPRRLPVYLLVDTSSSMAGEPIEAVRQSVRELVRALQTDPEALETMWLSLISFDHAARQVVPLTDLAEWPDDWELPVSSEGGARLGRGLQVLGEAIQREVRKRTEYQKGDRKPVVVVVSAGRVTDDWQSVATGLREVIGDTVVCMVGPKADPRALASMADEVIAVSGDASKWLESFLFPPRALGSDGVCRTERPSGIRPHPSPRDQAQCQHTFVDVRHAMAEAVEDCSRRLPIYLVLDTSSSMAGEPIEALRQGLRLLVSELQTDPQALETVWLSVITFASEARQVVPLTPLAQVKEPGLQLVEGSSLGAALRLLMETAERDARPPGPGGEKGDWKPLVFIMTDGMPTDGWESAADELKRKKIGTIVGCAAGPGADDQVLKRITETVVRLQDTSPDPGTGSWWPSAPAKRPRASAVTQGPTAVPLPSPPAGRGIVIVP